MAGTVSKLDKTLDFIDLFEYLGGDWIVPSHFLRWTAMSLIAACVEDRVWYQVVDHSPLHPNLWLFMIGPSGTGKDLAVGMALSLLNPEDPIWKIDGKVTMPAMYDYMSRMQKSTGRNGAPVYLISSDVTEQLPLGPEAKDFTSRALALYGGRDRELTDLTRTHGDKLVRNPLLNWYAGCTKDWFPLAVDPIVFNSGMAGRAFFVIGEPVVAQFHKPHPTRRHDQDLVQAYLRERVESLLTVEGVFLMSERARYGYNQWLFQQQERIQSSTLTDVEKAVINRTRTSVLKLAMIYALARWTGGALVIKGGHLSRAISSIQDVMDGVVAVSDFAYVTMDTATLDNVRDIIRAEGAITKSALTKQSLRRGVKDATHLDRLLDALRQAGEIEFKKFRPTGSKGGPWPLTIVWKTRKIMLSEEAPYEEAKDNSGLPDRTSPPT